MDLYQEEIKRIDKENERIDTLAIDKKRSKLLEIYINETGITPDTNYSADKLSKKIKYYRFNKFFKKETGQDLPEATKLTNKNKEQLFDIFEKAIRKTRGQIKGKTQIEEIKEIKDTPEQQIAFYKKEKQARFEKGVSPSRELTIQEYNKPKQQYKKPEIKTIKDIQEKADQLTFNPAFKELLNKQQTETIIKTNDYLKPKKDEKKKPISFVDEEFEKRQKQKKLKKPKEKEERPISEFQYEMMKAEANEIERIKQRERDELYFPPPPNPQVFPNQNLNIDEFEKIGEPEFQTDILKEMNKPKPNRPVFSSPQAERNYFDILKQVKEGEERDIIKAKEKEEREQKILDDKTKKARGLAFKKEDEPYKPKTERQREGLEKYERSEPLYKIREREEEKFKERDKQRGHETKTQLIGEGFKLGGEIVKTAGTLGREAIGGYFSQETQKLKGQQAKELKQLEADLLRQSKEHELELKQKSLPYELEREEKLKNINLDRENRLKDIDIEKIKVIGDIDIKKAKVGAKASQKIAQLENASALNRQIQAQIQSQMINTNTMRPYEPLSMLGSDRRPDDHKNLTIPMRGEGGVVQIINKPVYTRTPAQRRATRTRKPKQLKTSKIKLSKSRL
jgi:hypothetical protein